MFSPQATQMAMEQMKRMTPEQIANIQKQAQNMSPEMMQMAQQQMAGMGDSDWQNLRTQMNGLPQMDLQQQLDQNQGLQNGYKQNSQGLEIQLTPEQRTKLQEATTIKNQGNKFFKQSQYQKGIKKYQEAQNSLEKVFKIDGVQKCEGGQQVWSLYSICILNSAQCYRSEKKNKECVDLCSIIIKGDDQNVKALYRRSLANIDLQNRKQAKKDLQSALKISKQNSDPLLPDIKQTLQDLVDQYLESDDLENNQDSDNTLQEPKGNDTMLHKNNITPNENLQASNPLQDPKLLKHMFESMSDQQMYSMLKNSGFPNSEKLDITMIENMRKQINSIDGEQLLQFANMGVQQAQAQGSGAALQQQTVQPSVNLDEIRQNNPQMFQQAMQGIQNMPPEHLQKLLQQSGQLNGNNALNAQMLQNPDTIRNVQNQFANMDEDTFKKYAQLAQQLQGQTQKNLSTNMQSGGISSSTQANSQSQQQIDMLRNIQQMQGAQGKNMDMNEAMKSMDSMNVDMFKTMKTFLNNMDNDAILPMFKQVYPQMSEDQLQQIVQSVKGMDDNQLEFIFNASKRLQGAQKLFQSIWQIVLQNYLIILSIVSVVVALLLRYFNIV